jgi:hypothetical protein
MQKRDATRIKNLAYDIRVLCGDIVKKAKEMERVIGKEEPETMDDYCEARKKGFEGK